MSSDFYLPSLSRNLVRTGTLAYREIAAIRHALDEAEEAKPHDFGEPSSSRAFPDFGHEADAGLQSTFHGRVRFRMLKASLRKSSTAESPTP